jgi:hypothetical protein
VKARITKLAEKARTVSRISIKASYPFIPGLAGLALISLGVSFIYLPAGLIAGGIALLWLDNRI